MDYFSIQAKRHHEKKTHQSKSSTQKAMTMTFLFMESKPITSKYKEENSALIFVSHIQSENDLVNLFHPLMEYLEQQYQDASATKFQGAIDILGSSESDSIDALMLLKLVV